MTATNEFAAHVGLDCADKKHDVCVHLNSGKSVSHMIEPIAELPDVWLAELHQKVQGWIDTALGRRKNPGHVLFKKIPFSKLRVNALSRARYQQPSRPAVLQMTRRVPSWN